MGIEWAAEASDQRYDPNSGALLTQMTSSATSINIYCEQPYTSPDGNRIAILRRNDVSFDPTWRLVVGDLTTLRVTMIEADGVVGVCNAAWSGLLHYTMADGSMRRVNLETLDREDVGLPETMDLRGRGGSMSPDQRHIVYSRKVEGPEVAIVVADLKERKEAIILQHPEITNPHLQFNPVHGEEILVQHNRGSKMNAEGDIIQVVSEEGTTHFVIALDGSNQRPLPAGPPHTGPSTGHSNFVADTGRVAWTTGWDRSDWSLGKLNRGSNLFVAAPCDVDATSIPTPEHRFNHINVSRCGRYFLCDSAPGSMYGDDGELRPPCLVVGNLETGRHRVLVTNTGSRGGGGQHQHPHAYLTADNGSAIFNSNYFGDTTQVWAARIPGDFLKSLD